MKQNLRKNIYMCTCVLVAQLCPTLCNPMDCSPLGFSFLGILQARILEWFAISFSNIYMCVCMYIYIYDRASLVAQTVKRLSTMWETQIQSLGWEDPLEKEMTIPSSTIAWKIPWTEEPGRLQSMGSQRVRHDWATLSYIYIWIYIYIYFSSKKWKVSKNLESSIREQKSPTMRKVRMEKEKFIIQKTYLG